MSFAGAVDSFAIGINNAGDIVGCWDMGGNGYPTAGFELIGGAYTTLPQYPGQTYTCPTAINNNGDIVGYYLPTNFDSGYGFLLRSGTYTTIQVPGAALTEVYGITDSGEMAGFYCPTVACATGTGQAFRAAFRKIFCWRWGRSVLGTLAFTLVELSGRPATQSRAEPVLSSAAHPYVLPLRRLHV